MFQQITRFLLVGLLFCFGPVKGQEAPSVDIHWPAVVIAGIDFEIGFSANPKTAPDSLVVYLNDQVHTLPFRGGKAALVQQLHDKTNLQLRLADHIESRPYRPIPLGWSILPPLIAIMLALLFKEVYSALLLGLLSGTLIIGWYTHDFWGGLGFGFFSLIDTYIIQALNSFDHLAVLVFSLLIGGMVGVITRNGGMQGIVNRISKRATDPRSGQLATWFLGIAIFFDDYSNTLLVGNTMRPVTDKLRISREKLSYLVDSTAAPVAAIAFITTWIGAELGYIQDGISSIDGLDENPYNVFINSLQYSFYPILTLCFMLFLIWQRKDYGPMFEAEKNARNRTDNSLQQEHHANSLDVFAQKEGISAKGRYALLPVLAVVGVTVAGLFYTGYSAEVWNDGSLPFLRRVSAVIGNANSYLALLWGSFSGVLVASAMSLGGKKLNLEEVIEALMAGFKTMMGAIMILVLAWSLATLTQELHTADFITGNLLEMNLAPQWLPVLTFLLGAVVAFSTGSSWGTMAILYPLMLPAAWRLCQEAGMDYEQSLSIFHNVVSCVLAGAVLGDHCSPISDTTILSSLASGANHIQHVRTQLPYALTVGGVAILFGTIPAAFGISALVLFPVALLVLWGIVKYVGKRTD
jgi:Na+/H+ antiporter NhaC